MSIDDSRGALRALAAARGDSLAGLSAMIGRNSAYLQQFVGRGSPRRLPERERRLLADYFGVAETALGGPPAPAVPLRIRRLDVAASAGPGALVDAEIVLGSDMIGPELVRALKLDVARASLIRVRGDSMEPGLRDGDHIVIDERDTRPGAKSGVYVLRIAGATMVKRVTRLRDGLVVASDNPAVPALPDNAGQIAEIVGRVVWQMRGVV